MSLEPLRLTPLSPQAEDDDPQQRDRPWSRGAVAVRVGAVAALLISGSATWLGGVRPTVLLVLATLLLGGIAARLPDSPAGTLAGLLVIWWWTVADLPLWHWSGLVGLIGLVAAHVLLTVAALTPHSMPPDPAVLRLWARRGAALALAGGVVLAAGWALSRGGVGQAVVLVALPAALATALFLVVLTARQRPRV